MASTILLLGACPAMEMILTKCLTANQHDVVAVPTLQAAEAFVRVSPPDVVIANCSGEPPATLLQTLADYGVDTSPEDALQVILLDRDISPERRVAALVAGARDLIGWPVNQRLLLARLRGILRETHAVRETRRREAAATRLGFSEEAQGFEPARTIAFVASEERGSMLDDVDTTSLSARILRLTPEKALSDIEQGTAVDVFIVDGTNLSMAVSFNTLPELRTRAHSRNAAILFVHNLDAPEVAASALDSGASDIVSGDALPEELVHRIGTLLVRKLDDDALRKSSELSLQLAVTDPLTGLFNRRYAQSYLESSIKDSDGASEFTTMILDIDHFKRINDTYGHAAGDAVLREVAVRMRDTLRSIDMVSRYGGEEFLIVLPGTVMAQAGPAADRLRRKIGGAPIRLADGRSVRVTVSIGVAVGTRIPEARQGVRDTYSAVINGTRDRVDRLLEQADKALYVAKEAGRNRIEVAEASA